MRTLTLTTVIGLAGCASPQTTDRSIDEVLVGRCTRAEYRFGRTRMRGELRFAAGSRVIEARERQELGDDVSCATWALPRFRVGSAIG